MYVREKIRGHLTLKDKGELEHIRLADFDKWVDNKIVQKKAMHTPKHQCIPKWLRPQCGAKTRSGGACKATPVWDKVNDKPRNGRCRIHGGLSTGPKRQVSSIQG